MKNRLMVGDLGVVVEKDRFHFTPHLGLDRVPRQNPKIEQVSWKKGEIPRQNPQTERVLWKENEKSTTKH